MIGVKLPPPAAGSVLKPNAFTVIVSSPKCCDRLTARHVPVDREFHILQSSNASCRAAGSGPSKRLHIRHRDRLEKFGIVRQRQKFFDAQRDLMQRFPVFVDVLDTVSLALLRRAVGHTRIGVIAGDIKTNLSRVIYLHFGRHAFGCLQVRGDVVLPPMEIEVADYRQLETFRLPLDIALRCARNAVRAKLDKCLLHHVRDGGAIFLAALVRRHRGKNVVLSEGGVDDSGKVRPDSIVRLSRHP